MEAADTLRINTAGSVDDGKSTLIGRLLFDAHAILQDQLAAIESATRAHGHVAVGERHDFALLTDGLIAEREQGITIDVAYRYFTTAQRRYILADTPGHEQYTRNMVTGASTADVAVVLVDAKRGVSLQTHRHLAIAAMLAIPQVIVAINKMDLVDYDESVFKRLGDEISAVAVSCALSRVSYIPMSALHGEMVVACGDKMHWYRGPTLMESLEMSDAHLLQPVQMRLPVQAVSQTKFGERGELRGYRGTLASGQLRVGDALVALPSNHTATVAEIRHFDRAVTTASAGEAITVVLAEQIDLSRGDWLVNPLEQMPMVAASISADLCWFDPTPLVIGQRYWLKHGTKLTRAIVESIEHVLDVGTLQARMDESPSVSLNDLARVTLSTQAPIVFDPYRAHREMGCFILIDDASNNTVAAGMIV